MIIESEADVARAVLAEAERAADPRFRRILQAAVGHLHDFVRDAELTEAELRQISGLRGR